ncbi:MAG: hypothetical protein PGN13_05300 [Patulibacter minatonensis]
MSHARRAAFPRRAIPRLCLPALLGFATLGTPALGAVVNAPAASTFRDSIGVQLHTDFRDHAYQADTAARVTSAITELGVRHVRDKVCMDDSVEICAKVASKLQTVGAGVGAATTTDLIMGVVPTVDSTDPRADRDRDILIALRRLRDAPYLPSVTALELVNEPDLSKKPYWASQTVEDARTVRRLLATDEFAALAHLPVLAPPLARQSNAGALLAAGWTPDLADLPNLHPYPTTYGIPEASLDTTCDGTRTMLDCARSLATDTAPPIATETGYSTAGSVLVADWVSQRAQATYLLRLLLDNFSAGVARTYLYELVDLEASATLRNHGYGLMTARVAADRTLRFGSPKLAYLALQRMNAVIGDLGAGARPGTLDVSLTDPATGTEVPADQVEQVALRRADGSYVLAVWQRAKSFQFINFTPRDLTVAPRQVTVTLDGSRGEWTARSFVPNLSASATGTWSGSSFSLPVDDDVTLIDLTPPAGLSEPAEPTPTPAPDSTPTPTPAPTPDADPAPAPVTLSTPEATPTTAGPSGDLPATEAPTAPRTDGPRPAAESRTATPAAQLPARDPAAVAREKANRHERARIRASRAYDACLDRRVARAQRRTRAGSARLRPMRPTPGMRARCGRSLAR